MNTLGGYVDFFLYSADTRAVEKSAFDLYHARVQSRLYRLDFSVSLVSTLQLIQIWAAGYAGCILGHSALILCFLNTNYRFSAIDRFLIILIFLFSQVVYQTLLPHWLGFYET